jgi:uncharacterized protein (DUF2141 family)
MERKVSNLVVMALVAIAAIVSSCASIGRPEGGPRDVTPPKYVRSTPAPNELNFDGQKLEIFFDENVQLDDAFNKVIVSPVQKTTPVVRASGHRVTVELRDTLRDSTTYTVDFADAIKDLNEGNILDGFAIDFSTGPTIDTLRISGIVLEARTLEPAQSMTVGIYSNLADSAIRTLQLERIARTNQLGQFTVRGLKPGRYHVYALNDVNRDQRWDRSEDVAFSDLVYEPYSENITVNDTLRTENGTDSIAQRPGVAYYPNDVLLTWFNENFQAQYLKDNTRPDRRKIIINMAAPSDTLPVITVADGEFEGLNADDFALLHASENRDSLTYWIRDPRILAIDSLKLCVRHQMTDTLDQLVWKNDTLRFFFKESKNKDKEKKAKKEKEKKEKEKKEKEKKEKRTENNENEGPDRENREGREEERPDSIPEQPELEFLGVSPMFGSSQEIYNPIGFMTDAPIDTIDVKALHLEIQNDTIWEPVTLSEMEVDASDPLLKRRFAMEWKHGSHYRFTADSASIVSIYGLHNKPFKHEFTVKNPEDYANLKFEIKGADTTAVVVELLDGSDKPVRTVNVPRGKRTAVFSNVTPGTYYARLYLDVNGNGKWDTGSIDEHRQPEEVSYFQTKLELKANWDIEQPWSIYDLAVDAQKPYAVKKNKPKLKKGEKAPGEEDKKDEDEDDWGGSNLGGLGGLTNSLKRDTSNGTATGLKR